MRRGGGLLIALSFRQKMAKKDVNEDFRMPSGEKVPIGGLHLLGGLEGGSHVHF